MLDAERQQRRQLESTVVELESQLATARSYETAAMPGAATRRGAAAAKRTSAGSGGGGARSACVRVAADKGLDDPPRPAPVMVEMIAGVGAGGGVIGGSPGGGGGGGLRGSCTPSPSKAAQVREPSPSTLAHRSDNDMIVPRPRADLPAPSRGLRRRSRSG